MSYHLSVCLGITSKSNADTMSYKHVKFHPLRHFFPGILFRITYTVYSAGFRCSSF